MLAWGEGRVRGPFCSCPCWLKNTGEFARPGAGPGEIGGGMSISANLSYLFYAHRPVRLTNAQAAIIGEVYGRRRIGPFRTFAPLEIYNQHTREHYLARRELQEMVSAGLIRLVPVRNPLSRRGGRSTVIGRKDKRLYRLQITLRAIQAWEMREGK